MAEELYVKLSDINQLLPSCCETCRERIDDLRTVRIGGDRPPGGTNGRENRAEQIRDLFDRTQRTVERAYELPPGSILIKTNIRKVSRPRQVAMYIMRELTIASFPDIGRFFHMHHTTVIHGVLFVTDRIGIDAEFAKHIQALIASVRASS